MKKCSKCKKERPLCDFHRRANGYKPRCKSCRNQDNGEYRNSNADAIKEYRIENREYYRAYNKDYYLENKDKVRASQNDYIKKYKQENKHKYASYESKRRAKKLKLLENYSDIDREYTFGLFDNACFNCGSKNRLSIDHLLPLSKGNVLSRSNAVVLCIKCNSSKGNKSPDEFYSKAQLKKLHNILGE